MDPASLLSLSDCSVNAALRGFEPRGWLPPGIVQPDLTSA
jgi:hypothetical protein